MSGGEDEGRKNRQESEGQLRNGEECPYCHKRINWNITEHIRIHTGETPYQCSICPQAFARKKSLMVHIRRYHTNERPYPCRYCPKSFVSCGERGTHEARTHIAANAPLVFSCDVCDRSFAARHQLTRHRHTHTVDIKKYGCSKCDSRFEAMSALRVHQSCHSDERPFACSMCSLTFKREIYKRSHELTVHIWRHVRPFECKTCGKTFKREVTLNDHMRVHDPFKPFKCPHCPHVTRFKYSLKSHIKNHHPDPAVTEVTWEGFNISADTLDEENDTTKAKVSPSYDLPLELDADGKFTSALTLVSSGKTRGVRCTRRKNVWARRRRGVGAKRGREPKTYVDAIERDVNPEPCARMPEHDYISNLLSAMSEQTSPECSGVSSPGHKSKRCGASHDIPSTEYEAADVQQDSPYPSLKLDVVEDHCKLEIVNEDESCEVERGLIEGGCYEEEAFNRSLLIHVSHGVIEDDGGCAQRADVGVIADGDLEGFNDDESFDSIDYPFSQTVIETNVDKIRTAETKASKKKQTFKDAHSHKGSKSDAQTISAKEAYALEASLVNGFLRCKPFCGLLAELRHRLENALVHCLRSGVVAFPSRPSSGKKIHSPLEDFQGDDSFYSVDYPFSQTFLEVTNSAQKNMTGKGAGLLHQTLKDVHPDESGEHFDAQGITARVAYELEASLVGRFFRSDPFRCLPAELRHRLENAMMHCLRTRIAAFPLQPVSARKNLESLKRSIESASHFGKSLKIQNGDLDGIIRSAKDMTRNSDRKILDDGRERILVDSNELDVNKKPIEISKISVGTRPGGQRHPISDIKKSVGMEACRRVSSGVRKLKILS